MTAEVVWVPTIEQAHFLNTIAATQDRIDSSVARLLRGAQSLTGESPDRHSISAALDSASEAATAATGAMEVLLELAYTVGIEPPMVARARLQSRRRCMFMAHEPDEQAAPRLAP